MNKSDLLSGRRALRRPGHRQTLAFAPSATVIHLDIDSAQIGKLRQADFPVVGPLEQVPAGLADELRASADGPGGPPEPWLRQLAAWREEFRSATAQADNVLKPQLVLETLQELTPTATTSSGRPAWDTQMLGDAVPPLRSAALVLHLGRARDDGLRSPRCDRAKAARPDATVVCVDGDGCFQMTCQELATSVLEGLPIVVVIVNNGYLGMVRQWQDMFFDERVRIHLTHQVPDYARLAEAYGAVGFTVGGADQLEAMLERRWRAAARPSSTAASMRASNASR